MSELHSKATGSGPVVGGVTGGVVCACAIGATSSINKTGGITAADVIFLRKLGRMGILKSTLSIDSSFYSNNCNAFNVILK
ncbi:hypothetical protein GCM10011385_17380 [Nitratireductor aestuarii]|uniref:Uncharacterized protein n=1 Tax=Nitratireductor aestuarii TaxID=1735103 RepID=A0A916RPB1_9HYPH|nr:hypothetical protein GCM10011385_17380 [Nitratireductor aestuarii]